MAATKRPSESPTKQGTDSEQKNGLTPSLVQSEVERSHQQGS